MRVMRRVSDGGNVGNTSDAHSMASVRAMPVCDVYLYLYL